jgi:hypothetical protein
MHDTCSLCVLANSPAYNIPPLSALALAAPCSCSMPLPCAHPHDLVGGWCIRELVQLLLGHLHWEVAHGGRVCCSRVIGAAAVAHTRKHLVGREGVRARGGSMRWRQHCSYVAWAAVCNGGPANETLESAAHELLWVSLSSRPHDTVQGRVTVWTRVWLQLLGKHLGTTAHQLPCCSCRWASRSSSCRSAPEKDLGKAACGHGAQAGLTKHSGSTWSVLCCVSDNHAAYAVNLIRRTKYHQISMRSET